ncbi:type III-B CRISPR module RAMP protein Cmr1 [Thermus sp.]|uniref:type III-B CRISPR module RAMP protein Cmr1 n=1 Tax=Thermus sp. TaxID=275 RepID=UPI00307FCED6
MKAWQAAWVPKKKAGEGAVLERTYRLLTPLFGGGVEPKRADPITAVRPTAVRGALRFWWRVLRGWRAGGSLEELRRLEEGIFGSTERPSPLQVELEPLDGGREEAVFVDVPGKRSPKPRPEVAHPYLAYPLQRTQEDPKNYPVRVGVRFRLRLRFPEALREEVEAALWGLETFGGLGGRARRGFGALGREDAPPLDEGAIRAGLRRYSRQEGWPEGVPHLTPESLLRVVDRPWQEVAEAYRAFRQARPGGDSRHPGRSLWPEPDAIRRLTGRHAPNHPPRHPVDKFPRGQFGLPIVFHFKDKGEPGDSFLKGLEAERLASPLLLRPLGERRTLVAVLEAPRMPPGGVGLEAGRVYPVKVFLTPGEAQQIGVLRGKTDPIRAFVESL